MSDQTTHSLTPCPTSPNCVSSLASDDKHRVEPFTLTEVSEDSWKKITAIITAIPRSTIVEQGASYLHVEIRSLLFRFVDHLELALEPGTNRIDVRSASTLGYSDMGVNRKRVDMLRVQFKDADLLQ